MSDATTKESVLAGLLGDVFDEPTTIVIEEMRRRPGTLFSVDGLARSTSLPADKVLSTLENLHDVRTVRVSRIPTQQGKELYALTDNKATWREHLLTLVCAVSLRTY